MHAYESDPGDELGDPPRPQAPFRKANGPGRDRKAKARRASRRKQGGAVIGGIHRRGSKRRAT